MTDSKQYARELARISRNPGSKATMQAFTELHRQALADGALSRATKELIAVAVSIATHCEGCISWHVHGALEAGATADEIGEVVGVAIMMGGGPSTFYGAQALAAAEAESRE